MEFFGDSTWGECKANEIIDYSKNKLKVLSLNTKKKDSLYLKAIKEADLAVLKVKPIDSANNKNKTITPTSTNPKSTQLTPSVKTRLPSTPTSADFYLKKTKILNTSSQTDLKFDWTLESLISELEKTKRGADAVVDKCQELTVTNEKLVQELENANKQILNLTNEMYQLKNNLKAEKSLYSVQFNKNNDLKEEIERNHKK